MESSLLFLALLGESVCVGKGILLDSHIIVVDIVGFLLILLGFMIYLGEKSIRWRFIFH